MVMAVGAISSYNSYQQDPEYLKIIKELTQMGITPSGNKIPMYQSSSKLKLN